MNKTIISGRLTKDPVMKVIQSNGKDVLVGRFVLAVQRRFKQNGEYLTDFIPCVAFSSNAEFTEKYFCKGMKIIVEGRTQTRSYEDGEGRKVFTFEIVAEHLEFAESNKRKQMQDAASNGRSGKAESDETGDGFMDIPEEDGLPLPFNTLPFNN